jgi:hypothetical protein
MTIIATCGHEIKRIGHEIEYLDYDRKMEACTATALVCPKCWARFYKKRFFSVFKHERVVWHGVGRKQNKKEAR